MSPADDKTEEASKPARCHQLASQLASSAPGSVSLVDDAFPFRSSRRLLATDCLVGAGKLRGWMRASRWPGQIPRQCCAPSNGLCYTSPFSILPLSDSVKSPHVAILARSMGCSTSVGKARRELSPHSSGTHDATQRDAMQQRNAVCSSAFLHGIGPHCSAAAAECFAFMLGDQSGEVLVTVEHMNGLLEDARRRSERFPEICSIFTVIAVKTAGFECFLPTPEGFHNLYITSGLGCSLSSPPQSSRHFPLSHSAARVYPRLAARASVSLQVHPLFASADIILLGTCPVQPP
ncbi:hypothetical protein BKA81DRAFT_395318 [Phyllosticta paracitricarpa]|uniref:Uncharacterized protein n=1 Tax=Phyllosticta citricarpa TaxID=55181 RepID=A0ABR1MGX4_9PEZI